MSTGIGPMVNCGSGGDKECQKKLNAETFNADISFRIGRFVGGQNAISFLLAATSRVRGFAVPDQVNPDTVDNADQVNPDTVDNAGQDKPGIVENAAAGLLAKALRDDLCCLGAPDNMSTLIFAESLVTNIYKGNPSVQFLQFILELESITSPTHSKFSPIGISSFLQKDDFGYLKRIQSIVSLPKGDNRDAKMMNLILADSLSLPIDQALGMFHAIQNATLKLQCLRCMRDSYSRETSLGIKSRLSNASVLRLLEICDLELSTSKQEAFERLLILKQITESSYVPFSKEARDKVINVLVLVRTVCADEDKMQGRHGRKYSIVKETETVYEDLVSREDIWSFQEALDSVQQCPDMILNKESYIAMICKREDISLERAKEELKQIQNPRKADRVWLRLSERGRSPDEALALAANISEQDDRDKAIVGIVQRFSTEKEKEGEFYKQLLRVALERISSQSEKNTALKALATSSCVSWETALEAARGISGNQSLQQDVASQLLNRTAISMDQCLEVANLCLDERFLLYVLSKCVERCKDDTEAEKIIKMVEKSNNPHAVFCGVCPVIIRHKNCSITVCNQILSKTQGKADCDDIFVAFVGRKEVVLEDALKVVERINNAQIRARTIANCLRELNNIESYINHSDLSSIKGSIILAWLEIKQTIDIKVVAVLLKQVPRDQLFQAVSIVAKLVRAVKNQDLALRDLKNTFPDTGTFVVQPHRFIAAVQAQLNAVQATQQDNRGSDTEWDGSGSGVSPSRSQLSSAQSTQDNKHSDTEGDGSGSGVSSR